MRDPERPIGRIARTGRGIGRIASAVHFFAIYEGAQHVLVDDDGRVFATPVGMLCALRMTDAHPAWLVGTYQDKHGKRHQTQGESLRALIAADLTLRIDEVWSRAA